MKPFIVDRGPLRFLHFDLETVQSVMHKDDPDALCLAYTRRMMSGLLFVPGPRRILLLGLGGGSLAKFCHRHLPRSAITVVEIDPAVIALRREFRVPADGRRFRVVFQDAIGYVATRTACADAIFVDTCTGNGMAPSLAAPDTYLHLKRCLTRHGVLVINACGTARGIASHVGRVRGVFGEHVYTLPVPEGGNLIILATKASLRQLGARRLQSRADALQSLLGLPFRRYLGVLRPGIAGRAGSSSPRTSKQQAPSRSSPRPGSV